MDGQNGFFGNNLLNIAHRGFTVSAPENTLAAFAAAMQVGAHGVELDVRMCKTGEIVVFHDPTLARMTNGRGFVKNKSLEELQTFRIRFREQVTDEHIPTLDEVIELIKGKLLLNVEIKTSGLPKDHIEEKVVAILRRHGAASSTIISSFNPLVVRRLRKSDDEVLTGFLIEKNFHVSRSEILLSKFAGAKAIHVEKTLATPAFITRIKDLGFRCLVWSVNDLAMMERLAKLGVDGIITDKPDLLKTVNASFQHA